MKPRISKDRKHAGELFDLLEEVEKKAEKTPPVPSFQDTVKEFEKAIKLLTKHKLDGTCTSGLEDSLYEMKNAVNYNIYRNTKIELQKMKNQLEKERIS